MIALQSSMVTLMMLIVELATLSHVESNVTYSVKLHNGALMPLLPRSGHAPNEDINQDLEDQYRHFVVYNYGKSLGEVMHEWVFNGSLNYESIFITVEPILLKPEHVSKRLDKLLEQLQVSYVDLYLLQHDSGYNFLQMWKEMEAQVRARKVKAIGLDNYERGETIDRIIKYSTILPAVVSMSVRDYWVDKSFSDYLANLGIATMIEMFSNRPWNKKVSDIAERRNVSADEIYLRYFIQQNITVFTNFDVGFLKEAFEFNLSKEDIDTMKSMSLDELLGNDN